MGTLKLAYPLLLSLFVALAILTENGKVSGDHSSDPAEQDDNNGYKVYETSYETREETETKEETREETETEEESGSYTYTSSESSNDSGGGESGGEAEMTGDGETRGGSGGTSDTNAQKGTDSTTVVTTNTKSESEISKDEESMDNQEDTNFKQEQKDLSSVTIKDTEITYQKKRKFLKDKTFIDYQKEEYSATFYKYFRFRVKTRTLYRFVKYMYTHRRMRKNHNLIVNKYLKKYLKLRKRERCQYLYDEYDEEISSVKKEPHSKKDSTTEEHEQHGENKEHNKHEKGEKKKHKKGMKMKKAHRKEIKEVKEDNENDDEVEEQEEEFKDEKKEIKHIDIQDNEETYLEKRNFLQKLTYEKYMTKTNRKIFYRYFKFQVKTKILFRFIKFCYSFKKMPQNHNKIFKKYIKKYVKLDRRNKFKRFYTQYEKEIKLRKDKKTNEEKKRKQHKGKTHRNKHKKHTEDEQDENVDEEESEDQIEDFTEEKNEIREVEITDNKELYIQKKNFLQKITYEQYQSKENRIKFNRYFKFTIRTKTLFRFVKYCYSFQSMPDNHNHIINKYIKKYVKLEKNSHCKQFYAQYKKEIKLKREKKASKKHEHRNKGHTSGNTGDDGEKDYDTEDNDESGEESKGFREEKEEIKYIEITDDTEVYIQKRNILQKLTFEKYQTKKYRTLFYKYFKFTVRTRTLFKFIQFCYKYQNMPKNHNRILNKYIKKYVKLQKVSRCKHFYTEYEKEIKVERKTTEGDKPTKTKGKKTGKGGKKPGKKGDDDEPDDDDRPVGRGKKPDKKHPGKPGKKGHQHGKGRDDDDTEPKPGEGGKPGKKPGKDGKKPGKKGDKGKHHHGKDTDDDEDGKKPGTHGHAPGGKQPGKKPRKGGKRPGKKGGDDQPDDEDGDNDESGEENEGFREEKEEIKYIDITDDREVYIEKRNFLQKLTYEKYQTEKYRKIFYKYFKFTVRTRTLFRFIQFCYKYQNMPKNHNHILNKYMKKYVKLQKVSRCKHFYTEYEKEIKVERKTTEGDKPTKTKGKKTGKGGKKPGKKGDDDEPDDDDRPVGKGKKPDKKHPGKPGKKGHQHGKGRDDDDTEPKPGEGGKPGKKPGKDGKKPGKKGDKGKHHHGKDTDDDEDGKKPGTHGHAPGGKQPGKKPRKGGKRPGKKGGDDQPDDEDGDNDESGEENEGFREEKEEIKYIDITDDREVYIEKRNFLQKLTYEKYQTEKYRKLFYKYFKFTVRTRTLFRFIQFCYKYQNMPQNHNRILNKYMKKYVNLERISRCEHFYTEYEKEIKVERETTKERKWKRPSRGGMRPGKRGDNGEPEDEDDDGKPTGIGKRPNKKHPGKPLHKGHEHSKGPDDDETGLKPGRGGKYTKGKPDRNPRKDWWTPVDDDDDDDYDEEKPGNDGRYPKVYRKDRKTYGRKGHVWRSDDDLDETHIRKGKKSTKRFSFDNDSDDGNYEDVFKPSKGENYPKGMRPGKRPVYGGKRPVYGGKRPVREGDDSDESDQTVPDRREQDEDDNGIYPRKGRRPIMKHPRNKGHRGSTVSDGDDYGSDEFPGKDGKSPIRRRPGKKPFKDGERPSENDDDGSKDNITYKQRNHGEDEPDNDKEEDKKYVENFNKEKEILKYINIFDDKITYDKKRNFLTHLNFKKYQTKSYNKLFYRYFKFNVKTRILFRFIKHCYSYPIMPRNHNQIINKYLKIYQKLNAFIRYLFVKYDEEVKYQSRGVYGDKRDGDERISGRERNDDEMSNESIKEGKRTDEPSEGSQERHPHEDNKNEDSVTEFQTEKRQLQYVQIQDNKHSYSEKHKFLKQLSFRKYQLSKNDRNTFFKIFKFQVRTRILFRFIKYCYNHRSMPINHNQIINKYIRKYKTLRELKRVNYFYTEYDREIKLQREGGKQNQMTNQDYRSADSFYSRSGDNSRKNDKSDFSSKNTFENSNKNNYYSHYDAQTDQYTSGTNQDTYGNPRPEFSSYTMDQQNSGTQTESQQWTEENNQVNQMSYNTYPQYNNADTGSGYNTQNQMSYTSYGAYGENGETQTVPENSQQYTYVNSQSDSQSTSAQNNYMHYDMQENQQNFGSENSDQMYSQYGSGMKESQDQVQYMNSYSTMQDNQQNFGSENSDQSYGQYGSGMTDSQNQAQYMNSYSTMQDNQQNFGSESNDQYYNQHSSGMQQPTDGKFDENYHTAHEYSSTNSQDQNQDYTTNMHQHGHSWD